MNYIQLTIFVFPDTQENKEITAAQLSDWGFDGFLFNDETIEAYIPKNKYSEAEINTFSNLYPNIQLQYSYKEIQDEKWNETWTLNYYKPVLISDTLLIHASFHKDLPNTEFKIEVDPKMAFGTGNHATTYMILEEILTINSAGKTILDMGTGTGVLAILCKLKGSAYTLAVDNDTNACINTSENIIINNTPDVDVKEGDISVLKDETFDIIFENIWKNTVKADLPILEKHLSKGGIVITSGFYYKEYEDVKKAGEEAGLIFETVREKDDWAMVRFSKR